MPRKKLEERITCFQEGFWLRLLVDSLDKRACKALLLVQMGELSAARVSLEGAEVAPGTVTTLRELTNPERRPPFPRQELSQEIARSEPEVQVDLDAEQQEDPQA